MLEKGQKIKVKDKIKELVIKNIHSDVIESAFDDVKKSNVITDVWTDTSGSTRYDIGEKNGVVRWMGLYEKELEYLEVVN